MNSKKLALVVVTALAVGAVTASSAFASVETKAGEWYTGTTESGVTTLSGSQAVTAEIAEHPGLGLKVEKTAVIGGKKIRVLATGFSCVECKLENKEVTSKAGKIAYGSGKLKLTGATVVEPSGCTISSESGVAGQVLTKQIIIHGDWKDTAAGNEKAYLQFIPESGSVFWQVKLGGGECSAIEGSYNITGSLFGELKSNRGEMKKSQELVVGTAVQATTGAELKLGTSPVTLTGTAQVTAGGAFFGIK